MKLNISRFVVHFLFVFVEEIIGEHSILFDLHPGYSNLIISIRFLYNFTSWISTNPFLFLGLSPTKDPQNFPRWAGQNHPCGHPPLWGLWDLTFVDVLPIFARKNHEKMEGRVFWIPILTLPRWTIFDIYI